MICSFGAAVVCWKHTERGGDMPRKNTRNTKGRIISAAWKLFYEQGYEDTTVEDIVFESETSKDPSTTTLMGRTPCWGRWPMCSMRSMRS